MLDSLNVLINVLREWIVERSWEGGAPERSAMRMEGAERGSSATKAMSRKPDRREKQELTQERKYKMPRRHKRLPKDEVDMSGSGDSLLTAEEG